MVGKRYLMLGAGKACASHNITRGLALWPMFLFKPSPAIRGAVLPVGSARQDKILLPIFYAKTDDATLQEEKY